MELNKADLIALKKCNDVVFRYMDGNSTIEAIKRRDDNNPFEQTHIIQCKTHTIIYGNGHELWGDSSRKINSAFAMNHSSQCCKLWLTIVSLLKAGDELTLSWKAGAGNNGYLKEANLFCDHLELIITRKEKTLSFLVDSSVSANNNARMCQVRSKT